MLLTFTNLATCNQSKFTNKQVEKIKSPESLALLLNLLVSTTPKNKRLVIKILGHLIDLKLPTTTFEQTIDDLKGDSNSIVHQIMTKMNPILKF